MLTDECFQFSNLHSPRVPRSLQIAACNDGRARARLRPRTTTVRACVDQGCMLTVRACADQCCMLTVRACGSGLRNYGAYNVSVCGSGVVDCERLTSIGATVASAIIGANDVFRVVGGARERSCRWKRRRRLFSVLGHTSQKQGLIRS